MATISERSNRYRSVIRKMGHNLSATFPTKEMAELWSKYHEELIENMHHFKAKPEDLITLDQCFELKIKSLNPDYHQKTFSDFEQCKQEFKKLMDIPLSEITPDLIREITSEMLNSMVRKGGHKDKLDTGHYRISSPATVLRKVRVLASVISFMIEKGANITNSAFIVANQIKMSLIKKGEKIEDDE